MKIILLQSLYKGNKLGEIGEVLEMEDTTAKALIQKNLAKEFSTELEQELEAVDNEAELVKKEIIKKVIIITANVAVSKTNKASLSSSFLNSVATMNSP
jgi:ribosomal protein L9